MKMHHRPIKRRKFLETGIASGAVIAALPFSKVFSFPAPFSDTCLKSNHNLSKEYHERLQEIALRYGAEFGEVSVKMESNPD
ncbi:MAG: hypothetical protein GTO24_27290 [candidate division Zixibacteria bacterium]|nr:hypothetical protein [candidate division Zixibacteria bacterium]